MIKISKTLHVDTKYLVYLPDDNIVEFESKLWLREVYPSSTYIFNIFRIVTILMIDKSVEEIVILQIDFLFFQYQNDTFYEW